MISRLLILLVFVTFISCKDEINNQNIDDIVIPDKNVSYHQHLQPVFDFKCSYSGCHDDASGAGGLRLTSYQKTTSNYNVVMPNNPDNSSLVRRTDGSSSSPMPPFGFKPLTLNQIKGIRTWILEGAKNN